MQDVNSRQTSVNVERMKARDRKHVTMELLTNNCQCSATFPSHLHISVCFPASLLPPASIAASHLPLYLHLLHHRYPPPSSHLTAAVVPVKPVSHLLQITRTVYEIARELLGE